VSITKRPDGQWRVTVYDKTTRKNRHVGLYPTKRDAKAAEQLAYKRAPKGSETVKSFAERWTQDFPRPRSSTNIHNSQQVKEFVSEHGALRLDQVTRDMARSWAQAHISQMPALRAMFNDALDSELVVGNPFARLGIARAQGRRNLKSEWLTVADVEHLIATARQVHTKVKGDLVASMIQFAAYTGVRPGELWALTWDCINGDELEVRYAFNSHTRELTLPKNGQARTVALVEQAQQALETVPRFADTDLVFPSGTGRQLYSSMFHPMWDVVRNVAGRPGMDFYELRHFCATHLIELGLSPADVAVQLGHTDGGALVMSTYSHPSERQARQRILDATSRAATSPKSVRTMGDS
jgi:integrase